MLPIASREDYGKGNITSGVEDLNSSYAFYLVSQLTVIFLEIWCIPDWFWKGNSSVDWGRWNLELRLLLRFPD